MSKEIIQKIRDAEAQARKIKSDAQEEAKARVRKAEAYGKRLCERAENDAVRKSREKLSIAQSRADAALGGARESAAAEAEQMRDAAEFNMREAVRLIIAGVNEQCQ